MKRKQRYYSDEDTDKGLTPSELKRTRRERQKEYMRHWFHSNFQDPVHETPYNSEEGGYLYIWGGPYNAHEELEAEFGRLVPFERIEELANEIEDEDGIYDWAPGLDHPDTTQRKIAWLQDQDEFPPSDADALEDVIERLESGVKPIYGSADELKKRRVALESLERLKLALPNPTPLHGGIGHNRPPIDDNDPHGAALQEARDAEETISAELAKPEPNALEVAEATSRLQKALGWFGTKLDKAADSFASTIGNAAAIGAVAQIFPEVRHLTAEAVHAVTQWLSHVTIPL